MPLMKQPTIIGTHSIWENYIPLWRKILTQQQIRRPPSANVLPCSFGFNAGKIMSCHRRRTDVICFCSITSVLKQAEKKSNLQTPPLPELKTQVKPEGNKLKKDIRPIVKHTWSPFCLFTRCESMQPAAL